MSNQDMVEVLKKHMTEDYVAPHVKMALSEAIKKLTPKKYEKFLPCLCGKNARDRWYSKGEVKLVCKYCGLSVSGKNGADAKRRWNDYMRIGGQ